MATTTATIEVDPAVLANAADSDYASSGYDTSTASLTSSVNDYIFENGRRYHAYFGAEKNLLPTDELEQDRLDLHHETMLRMMNGRLHDAPLRGPQRILDIGTGTGIWAIDMADAYPAAEVVGTDLSPTQPGWVPPNCRFELDDAEREWTFRPKESFDYIHARNVAQGISDWDKVMSQMYGHTRPGGWVELAETSAKIHCDDNTMSADNGAKVFFETIDEALTNMGRPPPTVELLQRRLRTAGFVDIQAFAYKQPLGPWPKDPRLKQIGAMVMLGCETGFQAYGMAVFTRVLGMDPLRAKQVCDDALKAVRNKNFHLYNHLWVLFLAPPPCHA
ncbi:S-adenosyl-L-methionine-dependent methyltransferase [Sphaerosporella brunnea]|uniref:S-adenosyl-L-methionine-dependent methyltransferase n=1 Tax=Sphaerosporella brunnea TaxID=1250544 RepID=A0A5J5EMF7_9PEZI|nr:S-adenosyl-L-methionine-dependent methyltransferase [Sphaerosporella brunnea]